jgi:glutaminase
MDMQGVLDDVAEAVRSYVGTGAVADYIPGLASVPPDQFGMALAMNDGGLYGVGDWERPFSIQSISKAFTLSLALALDGVAVWNRVGRESSSFAFSSLAQLEAGDGIPRNPFVNAGALVVTDRLLSLTGSAQESLLDFMRAETGNPLIAVDQEIAASEAEHGHRNAAIAHLLASYGNLHNPVDVVLSEYFAQCSIAMSCRDLAVAGGFLSRGGSRNNGSAFLDRSTAKRVNSVLLISGTYDSAGEFAYRVGLPAKSGVGGGILAMIPGRGTICVWGPGLGDSGTSVAGLAALDEFTTRTGWSIF